MRLHTTILAIGVAATALLAACATTDDPATPTTPAPAIPSAAVAPTITAEPSTRIPGPLPTRSTTEPQAPVAVPVEPPREASALEGKGLCLDPTSAPVASALASLSDDDFAWQVEDATDAVVGQCPALMWLVAVGGNSAAAPEHVLFFADGRYLGTGTSEAYAYTSVAAATDTSVTVEYRWLAGDEPFCCPAGGPAAVTYTWDGSQIVMEQPLPPEMLASYGEGN
ncbi:conserved hypothetical protein [Rhodococcus aetherivorans]|uniref:LppP/LprE lipoprotein n=1 Tax=Rhodococcus aetherivorans TaxID=191292 RepID=A0ABQ0YH81_9NOCA|nr:LppP/LprE family lipoprotein [Rhodococcus aetherivorans]ETT25601.1 LppP/LprE lipoprotein [Rhodococcus rhodochrous ATCC 21198]NGP27987.1 LppP/LprE family lipoprotein [Rhodococcus aetherivorans]GES35895.1 conserved hypothetical protein [Rhodococcus aetherivorans]